MTALYCILSAGLAFALALLLVWRRFSRQAISAITRPFVIGFRSDEPVPAGQTVNIVARPQIPFKGKTIIVPSDIAGAFILADCKVGNRSIFIASEGIPARMFTETMPHSPIDFPAAWPGQNMTLTVRNTSNAPVRFLATILGVSVAECVDE